MQLKGNKTHLQWYDEADSFIYNWNGIPTLDDVIEECKTIEDIENPIEYGTILYGYIEYILKRKN